MEIFSITRRISWSLRLFILAGIICPLQTLTAAVTLPRVIDSDMVLQRGLPVPIWGWAAPDEKVIVEFGGQKKTTKADGDGHWEVRLSKLDASSTPRSMTIIGSETITLTNILVGEVWLCSGQSNMEKPIGLQPGQKPVPNYRQELASGDSYPQIRFFKADHAMSAEVAKDVKGEWTVCSSNSLDAKKHSAAAYFFAREIAKEIKIPVGLVESYWGGTRIEPWTPPAGFEAVPAV
jgi:sialate O-acetylesterase